MKPTCAGSEPSGSARGVSGIGSRPPSCSRKPASDGPSVFKTKTRPPLSAPTPLLGHAPRRAAAGNGVQQSEGVLTSCKDAQVATAGVGHEQLATITGDDDGPL